MLYQLTTYVNSVYVLIWLVLPGEEAVAPCRGRCATALVAWGFQTIAPFQ